MLEIKNPIPPTPPQSENPFDRLEWARSWLWQHDQFRYAALWSSVRGRQGAEVAANDLIEEIRRIQSNGPERRPPNYPAYKPSPQWLSYQAMIRTMGPTQASYKGRPANVLGTEQTDLSWGNNSQGGASNPEELDI